MKVLIACEHSGTVRDAFTALGHNAVSCDLLPTETPGNHYQGNVLEVINEGWDLLIGHPPCTYLSYAATKYWNNPGQARKDISLMPQVDIMAKGTASKKEVKHFRELQMQWQNSGGGGFIYLNLKN
jgi:hypothetical protein